jgi:hypothetical protein
VISTGQIAAAAVVTALGVVIAAWAVRWPRAPMLLAGVGALVIVAAWRAMCNLLGLNGDFLPAVSVGDTGCLVAGALAPLAVASFGSVPARRRWVPVLVGAMVGFVVNIVIL